MDFRFPFCILCCVTAFGLKFRTASHKKRLQYPAVICLQKIPVKPLALLSHSRQNIQIIGRLELYNTVLHCDGDDVGIDDGALLEQRAHKQTILSDCKLHITR